MQTFIVKPQPKQTWLGELTPGDCAQINNNVPIMVTDKPRFAKGNENVVTVINLYTGQLMERLHSEQVIICDGNIEIQHRMIFDKPIKKEEED